MPGAEPLVLDVCSLSSGVGADCAEAVPRRTAITKGKKAEFRRKVADEILIFNLRTSFTRLRRRSCRPPKDRDIAPELSRRMAALNRSLESRALPVLRCRYSCSARGMV